MLRFSFWSSKCIRPNQNLKHPYLYIISQYYYFKVYTHECKVGNADAYISDARGKNYAKWYASKYIHDYLFVMSHEFHHGTSSGNLQFNAQLTRYLIITFWI